LFLGVTFLFSFLGYVFVHINKTKLKRRCFP